MTRSKRRGAALAWLLTPLLAGVLTGYWLAGLATLTRDPGVCNRTKQGRGQGTWWPHPHPPQLSAPTRRSLELTLPTDATKVPDRLLLVGVMTADKYLDTRATAVYNTWGKQVPGRIVFFTSATSKTNVTVPLVRLEGVDDSYPPQKKSFLMLQYMHRHWGSSFEWFLRADDDVYVRTKQLETFLRSINSSRPQFIGQAGKGIQEEMGQLSLNHDDNFCMGGPGILLSRVTLGMVAPHVRECLQNLYTNHEDVELGRCVKKFAHIPCTWSYEMQNIFYHNSSGSAAFTGNLKQKEVHRAITLHPVKNHRHMYRLHNYVQALEIKELQHQVILLHRDISSMMHELEKFDFTTNVTRILSDAIRSRQHLGNTWLLGIPLDINKFRPSRRDEVQPWEFMDTSIYSASSENPRRKMESAVKEGIDDVVGEVMEMINKYSKQRGRVIDFKQVLYGYYRLDPLHGIDYILDLLLLYKKYRGKKMTVPVRRHVYLQRAFSQLQIRSAPESWGKKARSTSLLEPIGEMFHSGLDSTRYYETLPLPKPEMQLMSPWDKVINFILPLSGRFDTFQRFLDVYETVCLANDESTRLIVTIFPSDDGEGKAGDILTVISQLKSKYPQSDLRTIQVQDRFARALALEVGASQCDDDSLLFFVDVDMIFTQSALQRIRLNTKQGIQMYFPIVYSEYDPDLLTNPRGHFDIDDQSGYWRQFGFGIASMYKSDLKVVGGYDMTIRGWGKEDVNLYDKVVQSKLAIFRAPDPGLVHVYHPVECSPTLPMEQLRMCQGSKTNNYGSVHLMYKYIEDHPEIWEYAKKKRKGS